MSVAMGRSGKKLRAEDLELFETQTGFRIPDSYRGFLLKLNGGEPYPDCFHSVNRNGEPVIRGVSDFFGIHREHSNLYDIVRTLARDDRFPKDMFPIGWDGFGNCIVVGIDGSPRARKIYFWYHDQAEGEQEVIEVAPSFEAFLEMLCIPPEIAALGVEPPDWLANPEASHEKEPAPPEPPPEQFDLFR